MKFLCVFLLIGACAAAPSSLLRPAVDNSPLLKPAVEDNLANMHDLARPMRPNFNDLFNEPSANVHDIVRPHKPNINDIIAPVAPVAPIVEETPAENKLPIVQIILNVADPSLVQIIGPEDELKPAATFPMVEDIATFPLMPVLPQAPAQTLPAVSVTDLLRPALPQDSAHFPHGTMDLPEFRPATSLIR